MEYQKHEFPRRSIGGLQSIYCRSCGREIARTANAQFRTVTKCQICVLTDQGVDNAADYVLPQYIQMDPTKPPVPLDAESPEYLYELFPDEKPEPGMPPALTGVMGTVRSVFKAMGLFQSETPAEKLKAMPKSRKAANRRQKSTLFD